MTCPKCREKYAYDCCEAAKGMMMAGDMNRVTTEVRCIECGARQELVFSLDRELCSTIQEEEDSDAQTLAAIEPGEVFQFTKNGAPYVRLQRSVRDEANKMCPYLGLSSYVVAREKQDLKVYPCGSLTVTEEN